MILKIETHMTLLGLVILTMTNPCFFFTRFIKWKKKEKAC